MFTNFFSDLSNYFTTSNNNNNFYYLSLIKEENGYSIHGFWPQYSENSYPTFCKKVTFDVQKLTDILPELEKYWYSNVGDGSIKYDETF